MVRCWANQFQSSDHRLEPTRLLEADKIRETTASLFENDSLQIWTGDFNAITREDYSQKEWDDLTSVRERNCWELPKTELTTKVRNSSSSMLFRFEQKYFPFKFYLLVLCWLYITAL